MKIIGSQPRLSEDQIAVVDLLKEALAQAIEGNITSVAVVVCMNKGYSHVVAGRQAADLYMGCASLQREIIDRVETAGQDKIARIKGLS